MGWLIYHTFDPGDFVDGELPAWSQAQHKFIAVTVSGDDENVAGSGTANKLAKWANSIGLANSIITDNGSSAIVDGTLEATTLTGSGSGITNLNPTHISSGTAAINVSGNSATVTDGVYTTSSYADPFWIVGLAGAKISGNISGDAANVTGTVAIATGGTGATSASAALSNLGAVSASDSYSNPSWISSLAGTKITGNISGDAANVTSTVAIANGGTGATDASTALSNLSGVSTSATYSNPAWITSLAGSKISGNITGNASNVTGTVAIANGGTGATSASTALANLGGLGGSGTTGTIPKWSSSSGLTNSIVSESSSTVTIAGNAKVNHLLGNTSAPSITAGDGAGTSPTISISGTDIAGTITLTSGSLPVLSSAIFTVTFANSFSSAPAIIFSSATSATALLNGVTSVFVTSGTSSFSFTSGTTALATLTAYKWHYLVIG